MTGYMLASPFSTGSTPDLGWRADPSACTFTNRGTQWLQP
jgi:hypothetical protein